MPPLLLASPEGLCLVGPQVPGSLLRRPLDAQVMLITTITQEKEGPRALVVRQSRCSFLVPHQVFCKYPQNPWHVAVTRAPPQQCHHSRFMAPGHGPLETPTVLRSSSLRPLGFPVCRSPLKESWGPRPCIPSTYYRGQPEEAINGREWDSE